MGVQESENERVTGALPQRYDGHMSTKSKKAAAIAEGLEQLLRWVAQHPGISQKSPALQMTFRELQGEMVDQAAALGVAPEAVLPFQDDPDVRQAELELGMFLDEQGLVAPEYFWDLPLGYRDLPEYEPLIQTEEAWIEQNGGRLDAEDVPRLWAAIKHLVPERPAR